jgi:3-hydroxyisobutyrate dehydrogenase-like beta-hydroxyacid dehydrogenase
MLRRTDSKLKLGLVGCGTVGRRIGARALDSGHALRVHDRNEDRAAALRGAGAEWAESPAELAVGCDVLVSALPGPSDVEAVLLGPDGLWSKAAPRTLHVELSTVGLACIRRLGEAAAPRKIRLLDCPLSRGTASDRGAELVLWVGGHVDHFDLARPVLTSLADRVMYCGALGQGQVAKLVNNLVTHALTVVIGDALVMGVRAGGSLELLRAALHDGTGQTRLLDELLPASVFRGDWQPGLRMLLAEKDLRLAAELAAETGVDITALDAIRDAYRRGIAAGWGDLTMYAVIRLAEEAAGVQLRSPIFGRLPDGPS